MAERRREELNGYIWHLMHAAPEVAEVGGPARLWLCPVLVVVVVVVGSCRVWGAGWGSGVGCREWAEGSRVCWQSGRGFGPPGSVWRGEGSVGVRVQVSPSLALKRNERS